MRRIRLLVAALVIWLFLFYNIERLSKPIDITSVAYVFVPLMAVLTIIVPHLRKAPLGMLLVVPLLVFVLFKVWVKYPVWGASLPLTVTEVCAIAVTTILALWVSNGVSEFERAIAHITIGQSNTPPEPAPRGQAEIYREVRRARHHQRPLTLMAIGVEEKSVQIALDRMVQEVYQAMMKRYVLSDVARVLCDKLEDYDIVAQRNDHFLVLLPEVTSEQSIDLANQLRQVVSEQTGVTLQIGAASLSEDAVTFESLVKKAVGEMNGEQESERSTRPQPLVVEHHTT